MRSAIRVVLTQERRQCRRRGPTPPSGHTCAQRSQRPCPGMNGVAGGIATARGAPSPVQPGSGIIPGKPQRSCQRQLISFDQLALVAVSPEPAYPMKIDPDSALRKMALPPQLDSRALAVITKSHIHAILDAPMSAQLSRDHDGQTRSGQARGSSGPDNSGVGIMRPAPRTRDPVAGHHAVVPAVSIRQQNLLVVPSS